MTHDAVVLCAVHAILSGFLGPFIFSVTCSVFSNFGVKKTLYIIHAWSCFVMLNRNWISLAFI